MKLRSAYIKFLPFALIFVAAIFWAEHGRQDTLPPPAINLIEQDARTAEGTEFSLPDLTGTTQTFTSFQDRVVLVNFFATWCPPCREEMPSLERLFQVYKDRPFLVVGIAGDKEGKPIVAPFAEKMGLTFPVLLDPAQQVWEQYQVHGIPTVYLVDRQGRIAGKMVGSADWNSPSARALIDQLLCE